MEYIDYVIDYIEKYRCTTEEAEKMVDEDIKSGFINIGTIEKYEDDIEVSAEDYREWSLACVGLSEADVPYSCRYV